MVSFRPNYFIFIGYLKTGGGGGCREGIQANPCLVNSFVCAGLFVIRGRNCSKCAKSAKIEKKLYVAYEYVKKTRTENKRSRATRKWANLVSILKPNVVILYFTRKSQLDKTHNDQLCVECHTLDNILL